MPRITWRTAGGLEVVRDFVSLDVSLSGITVDGATMMRQDHDFVSSDTADRFVSFSVDDSPVAPSSPVKAAAK